MGTLVNVLWFAVVVTACSRSRESPPHPEAAPWWLDENQNLCRHVPYVAGDFFRAYVPSGSRYLNDHTLVRGPDGIWHLFGITSDSAGRPEAEHEFLHATAPAPLGPWKEQKDALVVDAHANEQVLWAPYVVERGLGHWTMFYYGDLLDGGDITRGLRQADSDDLWHWQRRPASMSPGTRPPGGRDPFVLVNGARSFLYSVGADAQSHGQILVTETRDPLLSKWSPLAPVITDPVATNPWRRGNLQSPFVVVYDGQFYLFVTRKSPAPVDYVRTNVFCSDNPVRFDWRPIADLRAHAAEIITDAGGYFITSAGWTSMVGEAHRGLLIAPLGWAPAAALRPVPKR